MQLKPAAIRSAVKPVLRYGSKDKKLWSLKTGGLLTQVNQSKNLSFWGSEGQSQVVLRSGTTADVPLDLTKNYISLSC